MKQKQEQQYVQHKKLILYFDINQTIVLLDSAQGKTKEGSLNRLLAKHAWGKSELDKTGNVFKLSSTQFSLNPPEADLISYFQFLKQEYPQKTEEQEENEETRQQYNDMQKERIDQATANFIKQGGPGIKLKKAYDNIMKSVNLPKVVQEELKMQLQKELGDAPENVQLNKDEMSDNHKYLNLYNDNKYYILPGFFRLLIQLKKQKREFAIVFRTFGRDLSDIILEFNKFCHGEHLCFNGKNGLQQVKFDGSKNTKNFIINQENTGILYRDQDINNTVLVQGTLKRNNVKIEQLQQEYEKDIEDETVSLNKGSKILVRIQEQLKKSCGMAIQDDWQIWDSNNKNQVFAKPIIVDNTDYFTQQIFFDDHVEDDDKSIVSVYDLIDSQMHESKRVLNKYKVKVNMIDVLKDPDYFIKQIDICEKARAEEIDRIERINRGENLEEPVKKSEFEELLQLSDNDYLLKTVVPLVNNALKIVDIERPDDPVSFIAMYCLKNKDLVKIPQPTQEYLEKLQEKLQEKEEAKKIFLKDYEAKLEAIRVEEEARQAELNKKGKKK